MLHHQTPLPYLHQITNNKTCHQHADLATSSPTQASLAPTRVLVREEENLKIQNLKQSPSLPLNCNQVFVCKRMGLVG